MTKEQEKLAEKNDWDLEAVQAYLDAGIGDDELSRFEEAYQGQFPNDVEFVQQLLEDVEPSLDDLPPYIHIDWEDTARDVMVDYTEQDGHYFRNL